MDGYRERIGRVLAHIEANLDRAMSLEELAGVACFSPHHFHRIFRGMVGEGVAEFLRRLRLERAAHSLRTSRRPVTRIAFEAGYQSHEAFTRAFKEMSGHSPSDYRCRWETDDGPGLGQGVGGRVAITIKGADMQVQIKNFEPIRVAYVRHQGPYDQCHLAWAKLCEWAGPRGLLGTDAQVLGLSYDDPEVTAADKLRYDACLQVGPEVAGEGEVGIAEVAGGPYAVVVHKGPYERLIDTYNEFCGRWMPASGREMRFAPPVEIYLNDPAVTPPEGLMVEIRLPLE